MNCRERCPHSDSCASLWPNHHGREDIRWYECPMFDKIEDHLMEARDNARDHPLDDDLPFTDDDYDGPDAEDEP